MNFRNRFFISLLTLMAVLGITFLLLHTVPGGPFDKERELPVEIKKNLYEKYGLHERGENSFFVWIIKDSKSYLSYLSEGRLGPSLTYLDRDVGEIILKAIPPSLELGMLALLLSLTLGGLLGLYSAKKPGAFIDRFVQTSSALYISLPTFVLAILLILIASIYLKWLPPALWEGPLHRILPLLTISAFPTGYIASLLRGSLLDQTKKDYIRTARSKGLSHFQTLLKHALKNAFLPLLTTLGPLAAQLITGSFIVESIFSIPGLGKHFVSAVINRDYFLVMGITLTYSTLLILLNWMVDILYSFLDPRIKRIH